MTVDGVTYGQSAALLSWAGELAGLYPRDLRLHIDAANACLSDIHDACEPAFYRNILKRSPSDGSLSPDTQLSDAALAAVVRRLREDYLPGKLGQVRGEDGLTKNVFKFYSKFEKGK